MKKLILILTWPGEPSTAMGFQLQSMARKNGYSDSLVLGLTNDYTGYFTTHEEYVEGTYDACSSIYNFRGGRRILKNYQKLFEKRNENIKINP